VAYLLRSIGKIGLVLGCEAGQAVRRVEWCRGRGRDIANVGVVKQNLRDVGGGEEREGQMKPCHEIGFGVNVLWRERFSFVDCIELEMLNR